MSQTTDLVLVPRDAVQEVIEWWMAANAAPGGVSPLAAIDGMKDAVWRLHQALEQIAGSGRPEWIDATASPNGFAPVCRHCHRVVDWHPNDHANDCPARIDGVGR